MDKEVFKAIIWDYYAQNKRVFPWRETIDPYRIFISEVMLQQTQTYRVLPKYQAFIQELPDFLTLVHAPFSKVLSLWSGLGYNRRAMYLQKSAQRIVEEFKGIVPSDPDVLVTFPGIGKATAASIIVFSYNIPLVFIETNIRRVFIHFFFKDQEKIHDKEIMLLVKETLDLSNPREWYYALMDYGAMLGKMVFNPNIKSVHYARQSKFEGSIRQVRGQILRVLLSYPKINKTVLQDKISADDRFDQAFEQLLKEGLIRKIKNKIELAE